MTYLYKELLGCRSCLEGSLCAVTCIVKETNVSLRDATTPGFDMYLSSGPDHRTRRDSERKKKHVSK